MCPRSRRPARQRIGRGRTSAPTTCHAALRSQCAEESKDQSVWASRDGLQNAHSDCYGSGIKPGHGMRAVVSGCEARLGGGLTLPLAHWPRRGTGVRAPARSAYPLQSCAGSMIKIAPDSRYSSRRCALSRTLAAFPLSAVQDKLTMPSWISTLHRPRGTTTRTSPTASLKRPRTSPSNANMTPSLWLIGPVIAMPAPRAQRTFAAHV